MGSRSDYMEDGTSSKRDAPMLSPKSLIDGEDHLGSENMVSSYSKGKEEKDDNADIEIGFYYQDEMNHQESYLSP